MWFLIGLLVVIVLIAAYVIGVFNNLKSLQVKIKASIQEIGNQLKRQASLIPNLESTVKGAAKHEKGIFENISSARAGINSAIDSPTAANLEQAGKGIQSILSGMRVVMESNPEMKANANFTSLMNSLEDTADKVMYSRRLLIDLAASYNQKLETFPSNLVAKMFGFKPEKGLDTPVAGEHIEVTEAETKSPQVDFE